MASAALSQMLVPLEPDPGRVRAAIWRLEELPAMSAVIQKALALCRDPLCSSRDLERVLEADQALVAQLLKVANSAFYSLDGRTTTVSRAVTVIGQDKLQSLLLQMMLAGAYRRLSQGHPEAKEIVEVSLAAAAACQVIAQYVPELDEEELLVAGLLHNVGELVLLTSFPSEYHSARRLAASMPQRSAQRAVFGVDAHTAGRWLLEAWGLPVIFAESTEYWSEPLRTDLLACSRHLLCTVHLGAYLGVSWTRQRGWQEAENQVSAEALAELAIGKDALAAAYESISEHIGRVKILLE